MAAFDALLGQPQAVGLLTQAIAQQRLAPAYLFAGPPGVGRTLAARCFVATLFNSGQDSQAGNRLWERLSQQNHPDLLWVQPTYLHQGQPVTAATAAELGLKPKAPPQIRLQQVRAIAQFVSRPALESQRNVVVLEQAETMAEAAANGLLKTLEEPGQATLILITPTGDCLLPTLVSRCQRIPFYRLSQTTLAQVLQQTGHGAILEHPEILGIAQGSPGMAISSWQQLETMPPDLLQTLRQPPASLRQALEVGRAIAQILDTEAQLWLVDYLQHQYWHQANTSTAIPRLQALEQTRRAIRSYVQPRLVWEVTLMRLVAPSSRT